MSETASETGVVTEIDGGAITYIDMGDYTLEIDNRGPVQQRRRHPKAVTSVAVTPQVRQELEDRIENEVKPLIEVRNTQQVDGSTAREPDDLPPVEDWEGARARTDEAHEAIRTANEQVREAGAEQQGAVAENLAEPTWGSASQVGEAWTPPWDDDDGDPRNQGTEETLAGRTQETPSEPPFVAPGEPPLSDTGTSDEPPPEPGDRGGFTSPGTVNTGEGVPPSEVDATEPAVEYAREQGIDLSQVKGTGAEGRVTKADVEAHKASSQGPVT